MTKSPFGSRNAVMTKRAKSPDAPLGVEIARVAPRKDLHTGKPRPVIKTARLESSGTMDAAFGNYYSPELSTDFLQLPQSRYEMWAHYRFFARRNPFVRQSIKLHTELPLSKIRFDVPKAKDHRIALAAHKFCCDWETRVDLLQKLMVIVREYHVIGVVNIWIEDNNPEPPEDLFFEWERILLENGDIEERQVPVKDSSRASKWLKKHYKGWTRVGVLPPEQVASESFSFTDERIISLTLDDKTKHIVQQADAGDPQAIRVRDGMPDDIVRAVRDGTNVPLNTDPDAGSFVYVMENDKVDYEASGHSILECLLPTLIHWDKLRQANASIASRHMTPMRVITAENASLMDLEELREQVELALIDPDYSIIVNYPIQWEEMGSEQRLLDLSSALEMANRELYAGLGVTEGLLTGESSYSGDRIAVEVINTRYMRLREQLERFVTEYLLKPMCRRMGFVEEDEDGEMQVICPRMSFSRLAIRDNNDTFEMFMNMYNKGSLPVDVILELMNVDPIAAKKRLEEDMFTVNDATFNEVIRSMYGGIGNALAEKTNAVEKTAKYLKLSMVEQPAESRF